MSPRQLWKTALIKKGVPERTADKFIDWHLKHPDIWKAFEKMALKLINKGRNRYGAKTIIETIRYHSDVKGGTPFKISNNYTAYYARIFTLKYPQHENFFQLKEVRGIQ